MTATIDSMRFLAALLLALTLCPSAQADEASTAAAFEKLRRNPLQLRHFMMGFPKGGNLNAHLEGSIYAENIIRWAAEDGKCVAPGTGQISLPPCDQQRVPMKDFAADPRSYRQLIDDYSTRHHERGANSGRDQFFDAFELFMPGTLGREAHMLRELTNRLGGENTRYVEVTQPWGMDKARAVAISRQDDFNPVRRDAARWATDPDLLRIVAETRADMDRIEQQRQRMGCTGSHANAGCSVMVRYLARVDRNLPQEQVNAQMALAFLLCANDPRYVGVQLSGREDAPGMLDNYQFQLGSIRDLGNVFQGVKVSLDVGELALGSMPPEDFRNRLYTTANFLQVRRMGHATSIALDLDVQRTLDVLRSHGDWREQPVLMAVNLTRSAVTLGLTGNRHPFMLYQHAGVPLALSSDAQGVLRTDLTAEYQRAAETYPLSYQDFKALARNALIYSFLPGASLLTDARTGTMVPACSGGLPPASTDLPACQKFMAGNEKAWKQRDLESEFQRFEAQSH